MSRYHVSSWSLIYLVDREGSGYHVFSRGFMYRASSISAVFLISGRTA